MFNFAVTSIRSRLWNFKPQGGKQTDTDRQAETVKQRQIEAQIHRRADDQKQTVNQQISSNLTPNVLMQKVDRPIIRNVALRILILKSPSSRAHTTSLTNTDTDRAADTDSNAC